MILSIGVEYMTEFQQFSDLKLCYFNGRGIAETSRLMLAFANAKYEDFRYPLEIKDWKTYDFVREEFEADKKNGKLSKSMNKLPYLETGGNIICQSKAIERFLAKKFNMMGANDIQEAGVDAICETIRDFKTDYQSVKNTKGDGADDAMEKWFNETLPIKLEVLDVIIGNTFSVGNQMSLADITLFSFITQFFDNKELAMKSIENTVNIKSVVENVGQQDSIKSWLSNRPDTPF